MARAYEIIYIIRPLLDEEAVTAVINRVQDTITKVGGSVDRSDKLGRKRLAYEIKHQREGSREGYREGFYVVTEFAADPQQLKEIDRAFKLSDDVVRHMITHRAPA